MRTCELNPEFAPITESAQLVFEETNIQAGVIYVTITNPAPQMFFKLKEVQP